MNNEDTVLMNNVQNKSSEETIVKPMPARSAATEQASPVRSQTSGSANSGRGDDAISWKKVLLGGVAAVSLGGTAAYATNKMSDISFTDDNSDDLGDDIDVSNDETGEFGQNDAADEMSFSEAFAAAREELGPGQVFEWNGNLYSTCTVEEWDDYHPSATQDAEQDQVEEHVEDSGYVDETSETDGEIEVTLDETADGDAFVEEAVVSEIEILTDESVEYDVVSVEEDVVSVEEDVVSVDGDVVVSVDEDQTLMDELAFEDDAADFDFDESMDMTDSDFALDNDLACDSDMADSGFDNSDLDFMV